MESLKDVLDRLGQILEQDRELPEVFPQRVKALRARLHRGQLHLAVLGQFKRGKSTLINALLGQLLLPDGVLPVTALPVFLFAGAEPRLTVYVGNGAEQQEYPIMTLPDFVTEAGNPQNEKGIDRVVLHYPAPLLQQGIVLIDTPGIGSTNENNTETTMRFLPRCDAAIVVFSADPPITAAEVDFLRLVQPHVAHFFFVLNKVDYLQPDERQKAREFLRETLRDALDCDRPQVLAVSARQGLAARQSNDEAAWRASGMADLANRLDKFAEERRGQVLEQAIRQKAQSLADEARQLLALRREALILPLAELEQKIETFHQYAATARQQSLEIEAQLVGDEKRIGAHIEATARELREEAERGLAEQIGELDLSLAREVWAERARAVTHDFFARARDSWHRNVHEQLEQTLTVRADEILNLRQQLRRDASDLLQVPHIPLLEEENIIELPDPVWVSGTFVPLPQEAPPWERFLPPEWRQHRRETRRQEVVREFASRNTERIRWWLLQVVQESVRHFRGQLEEMLEETIRQIEEALQSARSHQQAGKASRENSLALLEARMKELRQLGNTLGEIADNQHAEQNKEQTL